jgi:uncharacterized circularly permuted ATP-grasp superfamily protein/uncharacterized alpha-E superfamily protein
VLNCEYQAINGRRDEAITPDGSIEPEWHDLFESINRHKTEGLQRWREDAARISRERGLAYRPASTDPGQTEGWSLDPLPWLISAERWAVLDMGIAQRVRLAGALLADLYGPQETLKKGVIPLGIVLNHLGFVRCLHGLPLESGIVGLGLSAFDLVRDSSGQTFVVNDRLDCPFGLGLALENRTIINKVLPRLFRRCGVRRIGGFFTDWFNHLGRCAPSAKAEPLVVILDDSEQKDDSEISFLANYCGITRVHPSDLTVRDGRVWIRALRGLVPVDVIWKTIHGNTMDSLESELVSHCGIAGIFEAIRCGNVAVSSHPGLEVLQSPGLYPFLPAICKELLGEELLIPSVATWWCGAQVARSHVLANLDQMVIKSVGNTRRVKTQYGRLLSKEALAELEAKIKANPEDFVGQEELNISSIPTVHPEGLVPRSAVLRSFSFVDAQGVVQVMPGGLARVTPLEGSIVSTPATGESKDVWVRSLKEETPYSIASVLSHSNLRVPDIVPSRTGENLFWTGRYAERTAVAARFASRLIDCRSRGLSGLKGFEDRHEALLVQSLFTLFECADWLKKKTPDERLIAIIRDPDCPAGIMFSLERFHFATQAAREEWSPASILAIGSCYDGWNKAVKKIEGSFFPLEADLDALLLHLTAFLGLNLDSMTRDLGWALLDAGRRLERASTVCGLLRILIKGDLEGDMNTIFNESILYFMDSVRTYQSTYLDKPVTSLTTLLLLGLPDYPRSVRGLLDRLALVLRKLPIPTHQSYPANLIPVMQEKLATFVARLNQWKVADTFERNETLVFLDQMLELLDLLSDELTTSYFSHAQKQS